jgi:hypothetical protein
MTRAVRIGNGCGFWGDNVDAPVRLAEQGRLDYLTLEYLAELTMSILALQKQRDPLAGFATDFTDVLGRLAPLLRDQPRLRIITNAGGMNPPACAARARAILSKAGLADCRVAVVTGDDLLPNLDQLIAAGHPLAHLDTGESLATIRHRVVSANAYLGAAPIIDALKAGARVVVTGRVADASLTVAPAAFEFGWAHDDWDRLAAAAVAGHIIECGAQATGGLWTHWEEAPDLANVGYPLTVMEADGTFRITKPPGTGGAVNRETVSSQLLYEVGDPAAYLTPDVAADFTSFTLAEDGADTVVIRGARGRPAPDKLKVSIAYRDGFMASGTLAIFGQSAVAKAKKCGDIVFDRLRRAGCEYASMNVETVGHDAVVPGMTGGGEPCEVMLRVSVHDPNRAAVERFTKELAPLVTAGPPGVTGYTSGRPQVREVFAYWPALIDRAAVSPQVSVEG